MGVEITQEEINDLKKKGFSQAEIDKAIMELEKEDMENASAPKQSAHGNRTPSSFSGGRMDDMARYQLELNDLLEQTEHILKGDLVEWEDGRRIWIDNPNPEKNPLNKEGIRKIMLELQNYINRHIILGDYDSEDINRIMKDYGRKLADLIFMKYEDLGMDSDEKRQEYASLVTNIVNLVYGSYARAKDGAERRSLREMINIQQSSQSQFQGGDGQMMVNQNKRGVLNPMRYIAGKYV